MFHTVDIVMPLSAKPTSQCAFLTLIILTVSLYRDMYSQACRKLSCVAVQYPSQPPCSACFAHFSTAVSSPAQKALKGAFHSSNTSHLAVFNINPFFFHNTGRFGSPQEKVCSMGAFSLPTPSNGIAPLTWQWDNFSKARKDADTLPGDKEAGAWIRGASVSLSSVTVDVLGPQEKGKEARWVRMHVWGAAMFPPACYSRAHPGFFLELGQLPAVSGEHKSRVKSWLYC